MPLSTYGILSHLPYVNRVAKRLRKQETDIFKLQNELADLRRRHEAENFTPRFGHLLLELAELLQPKRVIGYDKIRVGANYDGGYVLLNDFAGVPRVYSLGVGGDVSFDLSLAERDLDILQFDHTVEKSPSSHSRFTLFKKKIERVEDFLSSQQDKQLLKIDIEGSEWGLLDAANSTDLSHFGQIVGEFHDFDLFHDPNWSGPAFRSLKKLNETHQLIHIHGNNCSPSFWHGEMQWPVAIELSYVLRSLYRFEDTRETFPGELDVPNDRSKPDFYLDGLFKT